MSRWFAWHGGEFCDRAGFADPPVLATGNPVDTREGTGPDFSAEAAALPARAREEPYDFAICCVEG
jgi:hypothetical protein